MKDCQTDTVWFNLFNIDLKGIDDNVNGANKGYVTFSVNTKSGLDQNNLNSPISQSAIIQFADAHALTGSMSQLEQITTDPTIIQFVDTTNSIVSANLIVDPYTQQHISTLYNQNCDTNCTDLIEEPPCCQSGIVIFSRCIHIDWIYAIGAIALMVAFGIGVRLLRNPRIG